MCFVSFRRPCARRRRTGAAFDGIQLAFDDFGTGYASLSYLTRYPVSRIKIDRSFVSNLADNAQDAAIVRSVIAMAHSLGLAIIAEGVEMADQAEFLVREKCEEAQGFPYAKPLPAAEFESFVRAMQIDVKESTIPGTRPLCHVRRGTKQDSTA